MKTQFTISFFRTFAFVFFISFSSISQVNLDSGLVGYFAFENSPIDSSFYGINGTPYNIVSVNGMKNYPNSAYGFDGMSSYIDCGVSDRGIVSEVSISLWVKTTRPSGDHDFLVEKYDWQIDKGYHIAIKDGYAYIGVRNTSGYGEHTYDVNATNLVNDGLWHHLLGVIASNTIQFYIDGELEATKSLSATNPNLSTNSPLSIGYYYLGSSTGDHNYYQGDMDEVRIYNRVLTGDEISYLSMENFVNSVRGVSYSRNVQLFPNPVLSTLSLVTTGNNISKIKIYNSLGQKCKEISNPTNSIDVSMLSSGIYFVHLFGSNDKLCSIKKLVKN